MTEPRPRASSATRAPGLTTVSRAGMLLGTSAAVYAVSLAAVAGLQADTDAAASAARGPALASVTEARAANDDLEARIRAADTAARALVADYGRTGSGLEAYQDRLDQLAALVADVEGGVAALPTRIRLPSVTVAAIPSGGGGGASRPPRTSGRSGASGG